MAIDPNIKQKAENIRLKKKGREVRESLAAGLEAMSEDVVENSGRQNYVESQLQAVYDSTRNKDVISAAEILASQVGADGTKYNNMKERLDAEQNKVNAQLAQIENEKASINYVDAILMDIAKGGPKALFNSIATLKATHPNGAEGTFLVMDSSFTDGAHSFIWDNTNSAWKDLGVYQATGISNGSINTEKYGEKTITFEKLKETYARAIPSKNLLDVDKAIVDRAINYNNGTVFESVGQTAFDFTPIKSGANYVFNKPVTVIEYEVSFKYVKGTPNVTNFTSGVNSKYVKTYTSTTSANALQLEEGTVSTPFTPYGEVLKPNKNYLNYFDGEYLKDGTVGINKLDNVIPSKNLFNKDTVSVGKFISGTGVIGDNTNYVLSDYIPIEQLSDYTADTLEYSSYFDKTKTFLSGNGAGALTTQKSPSDTKFIRVSVPKSILDIYQIEKGAVKTSYEPYGFEFKYLKNKSEVTTSSRRDRLYSIKDAWIAWENNQKFPVGFLGDSTTDAAGTTGYTDANSHEAQDNAAGGFGKVDYINEKAYPYILEQLIKKETGQTAPRIYNIGYSGTYLEWAKPKLNDIFGGVYADVKMVGITYGINDRTRVSTTLTYESMMRTNLEYFIHFFYDKGIQPFMVTSQATVEPYDQFEGTYPLRTSEDINSVANRVKRELANKYNLEIIEMTDFGEHVFSYSQYTLTELINDTLHFNDKGHELEAGFLFSRFCPRVITTKDSELLGFSSQRIKSFVPAKKGITLHYLNPFEDGFKVKADYTKANVNDMLMQDFWIMNYSKKQLELKAFLTDVHTQYVKLNGLNIVIDSNGKSLGNLDVGLHHIQAYSGQSTEVDFKGFTLS